MKTNYQTREEWMTAALEDITKLFKGHNYDVPKVRVSCGWPSRGGLSKTKKTIGQCWSPEAASDGVAQIFISPWLENESDIGVLPTLVHEMVHAVVGLPAKHGKPFRECAVKLGLEGKMTSTHAGAELMKIFTLWRGKLGDYPHAKLDPKKSPVETQSTRMIKMQCNECGYLARTSKKWLEQVGPVECPAGHGVTSIETEKD